MKKFGLVLMSVAALSLGACESVQNSGNKQLIGGASGAVIGGVLGSKVGGGSGAKWATGVGVLLGALAGSEIGKSLDRADMMYMQQANTKAYNAPVGESITWNNPESGNSGVITPTRDGLSASGRYCREYQQTIVVGGKEQKGYGTACQQPDGSWEVI